MVKLYMEECAQAQEETVVSSISSKNMSKFTLITKWGSMRMTCQSISKIRHILFLKISDNSMNQPTEKYIWG